MRSKCPECDRLWAEYAAAIVRNVDLSTSKVSDLKAHNAADRAWHRARAALAENVSALTMVSDTSK